MSYTEDELVNAVFFAGSNETIIRRAITQAKRLGRKECCEELDNLRSAVVDFLNAVDRNCETGSFGKAEKRLRKLCR